MGRPRKDIQTESVRLRADILEKARHIALGRKVPLGEYLSGLLEAPITRDWKAHQKRIAEKD